MKKWILFLLVVCCFSGNLFSQTINDAGLWATFNLEKKLNKHWELGLTQEYRRNENYTQTNLFYTDLSGSYKPVGFIKITVAYRAAQKARLDQTFSFRHRIALDILLKKKFGKTIVSFRQRIQSQVRNVYSSETGTLPQYYAREKLEIKYDLDKPFKPYASVEFGYQLHNPRNIDFNGTWNRVRYSAGFDYKLNEKNSLSLYYLLQRGFNATELQNLYITGIAYTLSL